jgi:hypothetical protein
MTTRMCTLCEANPVASDGKCLACLKDLAGPPLPLKHGSRQPNTPRGVRMSTPAWARRNARPRVTEKA